MASNLGGDPSLLQEYKLDTLFAHLFSLNMTPLASYHDPNRAQTADHTSNMHRISSEYRVLYQTNSRH